MNFVFMGFSWLGWLLYQDYVRAAEFLGCPGGWPGPRHRSELVSGRGDQTGDHFPVVSRSEDITFAPWA
jgi:hypothetical protein